MRITSEGAIRPGVSLETCLRVAINRRAGGDTEVGSNQKLSDIRRVIVGLLICLNGARGLVLNVSTRQLRNRGVDIPIDNGDDHALSRVSLCVQRGQRIA